MKMGNGVEWSGEDVLNEGRQEDMEDRGAATDIRNEHNLSLTLKSLLSKMVGESLSF